ncbi:MAG TPA: hypothetical protein DDW90_04180 [Cyanobacteria bacterium UBA9971]|nr:hypothetical protein [Cyanobacteria bacterium UBA9971]
MRADLNNIAFSGSVQPLNKLAKTLKTNFKLAELTETGIKDAFVANADLIKRVEKDLKADVGIGISSIYTKNAHGSEEGFFNHKGLSLPDFVKKTLSDILEPAKKFRVEEMGNPHPGDILPPETLLETCQRLVSKKDPGRIIDKKDMEGVFGRFFARGKKVAKTTEEAVKIAQAEAENAKNDALRPPSLMSRFFGS